MNIAEILKMLKSEYFITDLNALSEKDAELISEQTQIDGLFEMRHFLKINFYNDNDKNIIVNFYDKLKNISYEIICPITKHNKNNNIHIKVPKYLIRRNIYNTFNDTNMHVTTRNMNFIEKLKYLYNHQCMTEHLILYEYAIKEDCMFVINKRNESINIEYQERYNLYLTTNIKSKDIPAFYLTHSKRNDFSYGISQELDTALTQNLFGKNFNKLNKKELEILKAYLY